MSELSGLTLLGDFSSMTVTASPTASTARTSTRACVTFNAREFRALMQNRHAAAIRRPVNPRSLTAYEQRVQLTAALLGLAVPDVEAALTAGRQDEVCHLFARLRLDPAFRRALRSGTPLAWLQSWEDA